MQKQKVLIRQKNAQILPRFSKEILQKRQMISSKTQKNLIKHFKKNFSIEKNKPIMSKNDLKFPIYIDSTGFIIQYNILAYGLKCECFLNEDNIKANCKISSSSDLLLTPKKNNKSIFLQINLTQTQISIIKQGVEHKFDINHEKKLDYVKIVIGQNWEINQFTIINKKTKIINNLNIKMDYDQIYPLKKVDQSDKKRIFKLKKSQSKINIFWATQSKQSHENDKNTKILSFSVPNYQKSENLKEFAFMHLKKSFNQNDQTKDSEDQDIICQRC